MQRILQVGHDGLNLLARLVGLLFVDLGCHDAGVLGLPESKEIFVLLDGGIIYAGLQNENLHNGNFTILQCILFVSKTQNLTARPAGMLA